MCIPCCSTASGHSDSHMKTLKKKTTTTKQLVTINKIHQFYWLAISATNIYSYRTNIMIKPSNFYWPILIVRTKWRKKNVFSKFQRRKVGMKFFYTWKAQIYFNEWLAIAINIVECERSIYDQTDSRDVIHWPQCMFVNIFIFLSYIRPWYIQIYSTTVAQIFWNHDTRYVFQIFQWV